MTERWVRPAAVLWRRTLDGLVVLAPDGEMLHLSRPAAALLESLDRPRSVEEVASELASASGASVATVRRDIDALLAELAGHGAVRGQA